MNENESSERSQQNEPDQSKRTLMRVAWVAPVIVALALPRSSFAANISGSHHKGHSHADHHEKKASPRKDK